MGFSGKEEQTVKDKKGENLGGLMKDNKIKYFCSDINGHTAVLLNGICPMWPIYEHSKLQEDQRYLAGYYFSVL